MRADFASISNLSQNDFFLNYRKEGMPYQLWCLEPRDVYAVSVFDFISLQFIAKWKNLRKWIEAPLHKKTLQALHNLIWDGIPNIYADYDEATMPTMMAMIFCNYIQQANSPSGLSQDLKQKGMTRLRITEP